MDQINLANARVTHVNKRLNPVLALILVGASAAAMHHFIPDWGKSTSITQVQTSAQAPTNTSRSVLWDAVEPGPKLKSVPDTEPAAIHKDTTQQGSHVAPAHRLPERVTGFDHFVSAQRNAPAMVITSLTRAVPPVVFSEVLSVDAMPGGVMVEGRTIQGGLLRTEIADRDLTGHASLSVSIHGVQPSTNRDAQENGRVSFAQIAHAMGIDHAHTLDEQNESTSAKGEAIHVMRALIRDRGLPEEANRSLFWNPTYTQHLTPHNAELMAFYTQTFGKKDATTMLWNALKDNGLPSTFAAADRFASRIETSLVKQGCDQARTASNPFAALSVIDDIAAMTHSHLAIEASHGVRHDIQVSSEQQQAPMHHDNSWEPEVFQGHSM